MTPAERRGMVVGGVYWLKRCRQNWASIQSFVGTKCAQLIYDDGTDIPKFRIIGSNHELFMNIDPERSDLYPTDYSLVVSYHPDSEMKVKKSVKKKLVKKLVRKDRIKPVEEQEIV